MASRVVPKSEIGPSAVTSVEKKLSVKRNLHCIPDPSRKAGRDDKQIAFREPQRDIGLVDATLPLDQMTVEEKLRAIETLWEDLLRREGEIPVPDWHLSALRETEERVSKGEDPLLGWEDAKKLLRQRFE